MVGVASLELCRELYELSGWDDVSDFYTSQSEKLDWPQNVDGSGWHLAAYDLGYLMRKLPKDVRLERSYLKDHLWIAYSSRVEWEHDSPENATCALAIELFKQGVLTRGGDGA